MAEISDTLVEDDDFLQATAKEHRVTEAELVALKLALQKKTAEEIAANLGISAAAVRKRLGAVYAKFQISGTTPGKLESLRRILVEIYEEQPGQTPSQPSPQVHLDWGEAISANVFYDRTTELAQLEEFIVRDRCRLVAILGIGGIGKTTLSVKATDTIQADFQVLIWRSLQEAPTLSQLLADWFQILPGQVDRPLDKVGQKITHLLDILKTTRCLLVLDNFESILQHKTRAGEYRPGYEDYGDLLRRIGESDHQSCLMLTSREKPVEITALESDRQRTRTLELGGSEEAALDILNDKGLTGSSTDRQLLAKHYDGNPLAIKIVATAINDLFNGQIADFLKQQNGLTDSSQSPVVVGNLRKLLDEQFNRLSELERSILYWLVIGREPLTLADLRQDLIIPATSPSQILGALEDLRRRSLIEKLDGAFYLQNSVMEYSNDRLVETVCREIQTDQFEVFNSHALIKASTKDYICEIQIRLILKPIAENLQMLIGSANLRHWVEQTLLRLRAESKLAQGYAAGNLLNLLTYLQHPLIGYDFSDLSIRYGDLRWADLRQVNLTGANLQDCNLSETFGSILGLAFSSDGQHLAAAGANSEIRLWKLSPNQPEHSFTGHLDWVWSIAYATDHDWLASGSADGEVRLWDAKTGIALRTFPRHNARIWHVSFHQQDRWLASGSADGEVRIWDIDEKRPVAVIPGQGVQTRSLGLSPDGDLVARGRFDGLIDLWSLNMDQTPPKFQFLDRLKGHQGRVLAICFSLDSQMMASSDDQGTIQIWDTTSWSPINTLPRQTHRVRTVAFSPDGQTLVSGSDDGQICIWGKVNKPDQSKLTRTLKGHDNWIWSVVFSPDGQTIASGSEDQSIKLWRVQSGQCLSTFQGRSNRVLSLAISPTDSIIASGSEDHHVRLWRVSDQQAFANLAGHHNRVRAVTFSPNGQYLASSSDDQSVKIWVLETGECLHTLNGHQDWVRTIAFSPDGQSIASGSDDHMIRLWNLADGECTAVFSGHSACVLSLAFRPEPAWLVSGSEDQTVKLWNVNTGECLQTLDHHTDWVLAVAISPDGSMLASSGADKVIQIWDLTHRQLIHTLSGHSAPIRSVAFDWENRLLASGSDDKTVRLWNLATGQCLHTHYGHSRYVSSVAFNPQDNTLISSGDQSIRFWNSQTDKKPEIRPLNKPYEGMKISGVTGLTPAQIINLKVLGAVD